MILRKFKEKRTLGKNPSPLWDLNPRPSVIYFGAVLTFMKNVLMLLNVI